jgi:hypothetical protein
MSTTLVRTLMATVAVIAIASTSAFARTLSYSGPCPGPGNTNTWLVVVTVDDNGNVTDRAGVTCGGVAWHDHCSVHALLGNPSTMSDYYAVADDGSWWVRFNVGSSGEVTSMWGKTSSGVLWEADGNQQLY